MVDFNLMEELEDLVRKQGDKVEIHTTDCTLWGIEHKNCSGCPSELGCSKSVHLGLIMMQPLLFKPQTYDDYTKMQNRISQLQDMILCAKSVKELKALPTA